MPRDDDTFLSAAHYQVPMQANNKNNDGGQCGTVNSNSMNLFNHFKHSHQQEYDEIQKMKTEAMLCWEQIYIVENPQ